MAIMGLIMISGLIFTGFSHLYTLFTFTSLLVVLAYAYVKRRAKLFSFLPTYLVMLIPFFVVNGVLTGSWIPEQVVWYNDAENMGIRLGTVPVEDLFYGFEMLFLTVLFMENRPKADKQ